MKYRSFQTAMLMVLVVCPLLVSCKANDAKYQLAIYGPVHVYPSSTPPPDYPGTDFIAIIGAKDRVEVMQVLQKRDHVAVKVRLYDGREGWVFSGESIELEPQSAAHKNRM